MNPVIKRELEKVRIPLPEYNDDTTLIKILQRSAESEVKMYPIVAGKCYLIQIADYVLNEPPHFTLSANWNNGIIPKSRYLKVQITRVMGKMIQVDGSGYDVYNQLDTSDTYIGLWLPLGSIGVVAEL